jgi:molecular chaperone DnaK
VFQVIATNGDTHLGGDGFDEALIHYVAQKFESENGINLRKDPMALQRLQEACEKAKKELSTKAETDITLPFITMDASGPKHLNVSITRAKFEELIDPLLERVRKPVLQAMKDAKLSPSDIDEVVLVGGSTRVPKVVQLVKDIFKKEPHKGVNPDEVVAIGAAIQGSVLTGERKDVLLLDVTPLTLGIETEGEILTPIVERNTTIPTDKSKVFSTAADGQTGVTVKVYQGERKMARDNRLLGEFNLEGIPPQPRGMPQIEVKFDIDQNGILKVSAKDKTSGKEASVRIEASAGLPDEEIKRMQRDAEAHAEEDRKKFELATAKNEAEHLCYQLEKTMKEQGEKLSDSDKEPLTKQIEKVRQIVSTGEVAAIKSAVNDLQQAREAFEKMLYAKASAAGPASEGGEAPAKKADDDAIEGELEVKKD